MEKHEQLSLAIARSDLLYAGGSIISAGTHLRSWPFAQWGTMVAFEARKTMRDVHDLHVQLDWEDEFAEAARHGGKFFDGRRNQFESVVADFRLLAEATHTAYYPRDRPAKFLDFLRRDFAVFADNDEVVLTNVTGHYMVGLPPDRGLDINEWGPHLRTLGVGIGQMASGFTGLARQNIEQHGNHSRSELTPWDGDIAKVIPASFGGELETGIALAVLSIHSSVQTARRWARATCCESCDAASLKHRFVVLHHAVRSIQQMESHREGLGPLAEQRIAALLENVEIQRVVQPPFRRLRNGWLHLGLGDIASELSDDPRLVAPVAAYTGLEVAEFAELVDTGLDTMSHRIGSWLAAAGRDGISMKEHLKAP